MTTHLATATPPPSLSGLRSRLAVATRWGHPTNALRRDLMAARLHEAITVAAAEPVLLESAQRDALVAALDAITEK